MLFFVRAIRFVFTFFFSSANASFLRRLSFRFPDCIGQLSDSITPDVLHLRALRQQYSLCPVPLWPSDIPSSLQKRYCQLRDRGNAGTEPTTQKYTDEQRTANTSTHPSRKIEQADCRYPVHQYPYGQPTPAGNLEETTGQEFNGGLPDSQRYRSSLSRAAPGSTYASRPYLPYHYAILNAVQEQCSATRRGKSICKALVDAFRFFTASRMTI